MNLQIPRLGHARGQLGTHSIAPAILALALLGSSLLAVPAARAGLPARGISIMNTAAGPGVVTITIESFTKPDLRNPGPKGTSSPTLVFPVNVNIPNGSTALNSANLVIAGINAQAGPSYSAYLACAGNLSIVQVESHIGAFKSFAASTTTPVQTVVATAGFNGVNAPAVAPWGLLLVGALILGLGWVRTRREGLAG